MHRFAIKVPVAPMWCFEESCRTLRKVLDEWLVTRPGRVYVIQPKAASWISPQVRLGTSDLRESDGPTGKRTEDEAQVV